MLIISTSSSNLKTSKPMNNKNNNLLKFRKYRHGITNYHNRQRRSNGNANDCQIKVKHSFHNQFYQRNRNKFRPPILGVVKTYTPRTLTRSKWKRGEIVKDKCYKQVNHLMSCQLIIVRMENKGTTCQQL